MPARRGPAPGRVSPARVGVRRAAVKARSRNAPSAPAAASAVVVSPRVQVSEMQRSRLLSAAVASIAELGYAGASVAHITARARVSRRTFYDLFENREDCLLAVLDDVRARVMRELVDANVGGLVWRERVRMGLWRVLCFFDREPELAQICVVQTLHGGSRVMAWREAVLAGLAGVLDAGRDGDRARVCPALTGEGLVGATVSILHTRLSQRERERESLSGLLGELMGLIVLPYLGPAVARREQARTVPSPPVTRVARRARADAAQGPVDSGSLAGVPMRLTYRTARVLEVIAETPGASNRIVAERAGIADQGQVSKLLARLQRLGLLVNQGEGQARGERNAWNLTPLGTQVTQQLSLNTHPQKEATVR